MEEIVEEFDQKVYKKDSSGKIRVLHVYTEGADLIQESGVVDGALVQHRSTCISKNVGKANETTPEKQAKLEAASKIETKMSTGYFNSIQEAKDNEVILPMLAKDFNSEKSKIKYPCYAQPKLDGMRGLGKKGKGIKSRKGKAITTLSHIEAEIDQLGYADFMETLDGEIYAHGLTFQENMKIIKKYVSGETEKVKYHVYDMVLPNLDFASRYTFLRKLVADCKTIELVPTYKLNNEAELKTLHQKFISEGYEGTIVRHSDAGYAINKRDSQLLKYKDFIDITCEIIDIVPSEKRPEQGVCVCLHNNHTFHTGMKFSHADREEILSNKQDYIGKQKAEIRFFEYTDDGLPRFPVCVGFRLDK
jgi:DNA ligase-1